MEECVSSGRCIRGELAAAGGSRTRCWRYLAALLSRYPLEAWRLRRVYVCRLGRCWDEHQELSVYPYQPTLATEMGAFYVDHADSPAVDVWTVSAYGLIAEFNTFAARVSDWS